MHRSVRTARRGTQILAIVLATAFFVFCSISLAGWLAWTLVDSLDSRGSAGIRTHASRYYTPPKPAGWDAPTEEGERYGGRLLAEIDGETRPLPLLKTEFDVQVQGDLASVTLTQTFSNDTGAALNPDYVFPLNEDAAVYAMSMYVGGQAVRAIIQRKEEAEAQYEVAKAEGKNAALLRQHRPNMFQQNVANVMPQQEVVIALKYVQTVPKRAGDYELVLPLVVGPRFVPMDMSANALVAGSGDEHPLPAQVVGKPGPRPSQLDSDRVSIRVLLDAGVSLGRVASASHAIDTERQNASDAAIRLSKGATLDNRDFILTWNTAPQTPSAAVHATSLSGEGGHFSLLIEPPATGVEALATPREMVFVLDCSGSMNGQPMDASKAFMRAALRGLRPTDHFRVIRFSDSAHEYSDAPIAATPEAVELAIDYVEGLSGGGGTTMSSGIRQALAVPPAPGSLRMVTFLTDGYIGNEFEILKLVAEHLGDARLFSVGVGSSVNRFLLEEMARVGRGFTRYIDPTADVDVVASELAGRLQTPVLTDISVEANVEIGALTPRLIPDLFAGQSVRVMGVYEQSGPALFTVRGKVGGKPVVIHLEANLPRSSKDGMGVRLTWARSQIADRMHELELPIALRPSGAEDAVLREEITKLGLSYSLMTQWTAFVAVADEVVNPKGATDVAVPTPAAAGTRGGARYASAGPVGGAAPEPGTLGALLLAGAAAVGARRRRRNER